MSTATLAPGLTLHDYQLVASAFLRERRRAGLFLDMGLGKTCITLYSLDGDRLPALVVAPKRVAEFVWPFEGKKWRPDLKVVVAAGTPAQRKAALESKADIIVIGRDNLGDAVPYAKKFRTFVMDELSSFKTRASLRWKAAKKICKDMPNVWGLTGTPTTDGVMLDLWAQLFLLDNGESLGTTLGGYRERYFTPGRMLPNGVVTEYFLRPGAQERIQVLLERTCLSMTTDGRVELPPVTHNDIEVPLLPATRRVYKAMKNDLVAGADLLGEVFSASNAAVLSGKLSQITAGFMYKDDQELVKGRKEYTVLHKEKIAALREVVDGTGSPVLVGYRFQAELDMLKDGLKTLAHTIDEPNIVEKWNNGDIPVLLAHPASAGHGLNLQTGPGHTMAWATAPWSLEEYLQMNKRLARQGQKNPVVIHHLLSPRTVDPAMKLVRQGKQSVQDAVMHHLESPL